eukprot:GHVS01033064.1.p3 GENE.GHVS01033064.1~~GHVS01033064.1.p3  ORF type:complete len:103 (+),score=48.70 GHVS01033064.1:407-715(+)
MERPRAVSTTTTTTPETTGREQQQLTGVRQHPCVSGSSSSSSTVSDNNKYTMGDMEVSCLATDQSSLPCCGASSTNITTAAAGSLFGLELQQHLVALLQEED